MKVGDKLKNRFSGRVADITAIEVDIQSPTLVNRIQLSDGGIWREGSMAFMAEWELIPQIEEKKLKVWICTKFVGFWPIGLSAVVVAETSFSAAQMLNSALVLRGFPKEANVDDMVEIDLSVGNVKILLDGE